MFNRLLVIGGIIGCAALALAQGKSDKVAWVKLAASMVTNEAPHGDPRGLVDEQDAAGAQPALDQAPTGEPSTGWDYPSQFARDDFPVSAYLDLGRPRSLATLWVYDMHSNGNLTISAGEPGKWEPVITYGCGEYKKWVDLPLNVKTRYLRITRHDPGAIVHELVLYERTTSD